VIIKDIRASNLIDGIVSKVNTGIVLMGVNPTNPAVKPDTTKLITMQDITTIDKNEPNRIGSGH
jgi:ribosomal protein L30E